MSSSTLSDLMFPEAPQPVAHWEAHYPQRNLPAGARVTRFAPSPTGYLHTGGLYAAIVAQDLAHHSGGTFFVRIENTDSARENAEARDQFASAFAYFGIESDEGPDAPWGPYEQADRAAIYASYAKSLVDADKAYPCFCTSEELEAAANLQRASKVVPGYWGSWAVCRNLSDEERIARIEGGAPFVVRHRAPDGEPQRVAHDDCIRGSIEQLDNRNDAVILKSSTTSPRLPTYHFAHVVDDHLMRVNLVTRGEEWLPSLPLHHQLFAALGLTPPDYAHIAPLMTVDGESKRKLSKRKDPEANVETFMMAGMPAEAMRIYLRGLANGNLADIDFAEAQATPIALDSMGVAGPVFDPVKLGSISRSYIAGLEPAERLAQIETWAAQFDPGLSALLAVEHDVALRAFELERAHDRNPRKDVAQWSDYLPNYRIFFSTIYETVTDPAHERFAPIAAEVVRALLTDYLSAYDHSATRDIWFEGVRSAAARHGFAATTGEYKRNPEAFTGSIGDASNVLRIALTGARQSPDLYVVCQAIGEDEVRRRIEALLG